MQLAPIDESSSNDGAASTSETNADNLRKFEKLVSICEASGQPKLYEIYRRAQVLALLEEYSPRQLFKYMLGAEKEWNRHHPCPQHMWGAVDRLMQTGASIIRGYDKQNRPIVWIRESLVGNMGTVPGPMYCAYSLWVACTAVSRRPLDVPFITLVFDERGRKPLNYNLEATRLWAQAMNKIATPRTPVGRIYVVSPTRASATVFKIMNRLFPRLTRLVTLVKQRNSVFNFVTNPTDVPDYYGSPGTPIEVNAETVGDYKTTYFCRERVSLSSIFNGPVLSARKPDIQNTSLGALRHSTPKLPGQPSEESSDDADTSTMNSQCAMVSSVLEEELG
eukprot:CAMPEP_0198312712 /NCGR_PEP_ID=MMETSP1450-20131203/3987_1 /TAXON_ID=753684 ORGANISM="Madagascaria erythrocladiodes, Strain CCMP3234" /NCGR_SAMPLE_ID=MMETSP1450 /ASSEMBLY_ACC=CAM_ASM_001115 /LENGTH=334 /DNA_ID=CAMNT_0044015669 /DNA_START=230 /DNA_END=1234 /DNA_ORIENTATION=+